MYLVFDYVPGISSALKINAVLSSEVYSFFLNVVTGHCDGVNERVNK